MKLARALIALVLSFQFVSCSTTRVDPNDKKAAFHRQSEDIVWNGKVYEAHWFDRGHDVESMFLDDKQTQEQIKDADALVKREYAWLFGGAAAAITYMSVTPDDDYKESVYWSIFGLGIAGGIYYMIKRVNQIERAVEEYNKKKEYVFSPYLQRVEQSHNLGLAFSTSF